VHACVHAFVLARARALARSHACILEECCFCRAHWQQALCSNSPALRVVYRLASCFERSLPSGTRTFLP